MVLRGLLLWSVVVVAVMNRARFPWASATAGIVNRLSGNLPWHGFRAAEGFLPPRQREGDSQESLTACPLPLTLYHWYEKLQEGNISVWQ